VEIEELSQEIAKALVEQSWKLAVAESCTGGWIAKSLTDLAGSSAWFDRGFVTYSNQAKIDMLGVEEQILSRFGAVSEQVALQMAHGSVQRSLADIGVSVTGIAGPSGGSTEKPVGTVCFAWAEKNEANRVETKHFDGDRESVRHQSVVHAMAGVVKMIKR